MLGHRGSKDSQINVKKVQDSCNHDPYEFQRYVFNTKLFQSILSKKVEPERYNGLINLIYVLVYPNATTEEIQSALVMCESVKVIIQIKDAFRFKTIFSELFVWN